MSTYTSSIASDLNSLIETCKDGQKGFRTAAEDVKNADFKSLFTELSMQRQLFITELQALVRDLGEDTEKAGSVAGAVHRGWIDLRSALSSGDEYTLLAECERGEDSAVDEYRKVLDRDDLPENVRSIVHQQYVGVQAAHDRVRELRDRFQK